MAGLSPRERGGGPVALQGFRGTRAGTPSDAVTVQFGVEGGGLSIAGGDSSLSLAA